MAADTGIPCISLTLLVWIIRVEVGGRNEIAGEAGVVIVVTGEIVIVLVVLIDRACCQNLERHVLDHFLVHLVNTRIFHLIWRR